MSTELLLLAVLAGITLLGYMVAINSRGPTRLSISYLLATMLLAATVWAVVQHVNVGEDRITQEKLRREEQIRMELEKEKAQAEEALMASKERANLAAKVNSFVNLGTGLATTMMNVDVRDMSFELDALIGRAADARSKSESLQQEFSKVKIDDPYFSESMSLLGQAIASLVEAAKYYSLYYRSEDSAQEQLRERIMRQKARDAYEKCQKVSTMIASVH